ncbi:MAG: phosphatase PAP2 family protein, partial [Chitinophagaceae bacterium]
MHAFHIWLIGLDFNIWYYMNSVWHNDFLDAVMPYIRNQFTWAPVYLFLLIFMPYNFGWKGVIWLAGFLLCFALADSISASVIKPLVHRVRPCNDPRLADYLHLIVPRSSGLSFPSSHASNHFALGTFIMVTLHRRVPWFWPIPMFWAAIISYAQVYVGVHFPLDIFAGALLGAGIGLTVGLTFNNHWRFPARKKPEEVNASTVSP